MKELEMKAARWLCLFSKKI
ncbi:hypothetical protein ACJIZ3_006297 [Penstemon smallii]|uniref:Uncharacterized protein n=1 Tax=Penstemon smallii TaxID=265156 RepID=A0ABD3S7F0_9LAMI